ncbi:MAG TPA: hypothetical protein VJV77_04710 [Casimicrobiaceae bacterium]|nr:hypothetical protein [Casimicrobiaceae bacterium]
MRPWPDRLLGVACLLLIALGTLRLIGVVLSEPMLGYANQYDMARMSACLDLWPDVPGDRSLAHQQAPLTAYLDVHDDAARCYPSSTVVLAAVAKGVVQVGGALGLFSLEAYPLQAVGLVQALALLAVVVAFCYAERFRPWARFGHCAVFALILSDPANGMWLNTLYTEWTALLAAYATVGLVALSPTRRASVPLALGWVCALVALSLSRPQYIAFGIVPLVVIAPAYWREKRGVLIAASIGFVSAIALQSYWIARWPSLRAASNYDFYLGAVLPAVRDERFALSRLGLPPGCRDAIGSNWFVGMGGPAPGQCDAIAPLGRLEFLALSAADPALPARLLIRGLPQTQAWWMHYLGMIAGRSFGDASALRSWRTVSLASSTERLPLRTWLCVVAFLPAACLAAGVGFLRRVHRGEQGTGAAAAIFVCACLGLYAIVSSLFGDGYLEVARHAVLMHAALWATVLIGGGYVLAHWCSPARYRAVVEAGIATAIAILIGLGLYLLAARSPMAHGIVDEPKTRELGGGAYTMRGWAVDPFEVQRVRIGVYDDWDASVPRAEWNATVGLPVRGEHGESVDRYYPTYPNAGRGGFTVEIPRAALQAAPSCLRTRVENGKGVLTEIDRRCIQAR